MSMTKPKQHIIYMYTFPSSVKLSRLAGSRLVVKVGETMFREGMTSEESAHVRIKQQIPKTSNSQKYKLLAFWDVDVSLNDRHLRKILQAAGYQPKDDPELDGEGEEFFKIGYSIEESVQTVDEIIKTFGESALERVKLRKSQRDILSETIKEITNSDSDKDRFEILASLPPRFGKTIFILSLFERLPKHDILILPTAMLSSLTSFSNEVKRFWDYKNMVYIDTADDDWEEKMNVALDNKKKVVIAVSLHRREKTDLKSLRNIDNGRKFIVTDEADFAAWTDPKRQVRDYLEGTTNTGKLIAMAMSGTNVERMSTGSKPVDYIIQSTYTGMEKSDGAGTHVERKYVSLHIKNKDEYVENWSKDERFSWTKTWKNPDKYSGFLEGVLLGLFSSPQSPEQFKPLGLRNVIGGKLRVAMMFVSAENAMMNQFYEIAKETLKTYRIVLLNGHETTNRDSEDKVKRAINEAKNTEQDGVFIISGIMGSRSFSVSEIQTTILAYDGGNVHTTTQKSFRALTPGLTYDGKKKESAYIVSLSMDPNRSEILSSLALFEADAESKSSKTTLTQSLKNVLNSISFVTINPYGNVLEYGEDYLDNLYDQLMSSNIISKVIDAGVDLNKIYHDSVMFNIITKIPKNRGKSKKQDKKIDTHTYEKMTGVSGKSGKGNDQVLSNIIKRMSTLSRSPAMVRLLGEGGTYREILENIKDLENFKKLYGGITPKDVLTLLDNGAWRDNESLFDLAVNVASIKLDKLRESNDKTTTLKILKEFQDMEDLGVWPGMGLTGKSEETLLWKEIVGKISFNKETTFLSYATAKGYEVTALLEAGVDIKQITIIDDSGFGVIWKFAGFNYYDTLEELEMKKFDVVLMNPPYGDGHNSVLYAGFFKKALEIGNEVHSIMPVELESGAKRTKSHNDLVYRRQHFIEKVSHFFPDVMGVNIYYVKASSKKDNGERIIKDILKDMPLLYPERDRLSLLSSTGLGEYVGHEDDNGREVLWSLHKTGIVKKYITEELYNRYVKKLHKSPWRVLMSVNPSKGVLNTEVVEGNTMNSVKIFALPANTKSESLKLQKWLSSDIIVGEINKIMSAKNIYTISREIFERLPTYM